MVSVIIPTYNRCLNLMEAVESVLDQDLRDFELIVVDDGSRDATPVYMNRLAQADPRVKYIYQKNHGRSHARNVGLRAATGKYITFLDSDDKYLPGKLSRQVQIMEDYPECGLSYTNYKIMNEQSVIQPGMGEPDLPLSGYIYPDMLFFKGTIITTPSIMVRASLLALVGGFDEKMHMCEDLDLWRRVARRTKVFQIKEALIAIRYRLNERTNWWEYLAGRQDYYTKAAREDPQLKQGTLKALYEEMYLTYGKVTLKKRDLRFATHCFIHFTLQNPRAAAKEAAAQLRRKLRK